MNKYLFFLIVLFFTQNEIYSQNFDKDSISLIANWEIGEKKSYEVTKKKRTTKDGLVEKNEEKIIFVSFEILDSTSSNYLVRYKKDSMLMPGVEMAEYKEYVQSFLGRIEYEFLTDEFGEFVELKNWEEVRDSINSLIKTNSIKIDEEDEKNNETAMSFVNKLVESKEIIENSLMKEIGSIFNDYGYVFPIGDTIHYEEELPNLFGKGVLPAAGRFIVNYNDEHNEVMLETITEIDPEIGKQVLMETLKSINKEFKSKKKKKFKDFEKEMENARLEIVITSVMVFSMKTGWLKEGYQKKNIIINDVKEETIVLEEQIFKRI